MDIITLKNEFPKRIEEINFLVDKTNKSSVLVIQQFPIEEDRQILLPNVRESISNIIAFVELGDVESLEYIISQSDGFFSAIAIDSDVKCARSKPLLRVAKDKVLKSKLFFYSDNLTWADSAINFIQNIENGLLEKKVLITGQGWLFKLLIQILSNFQVEVSWYNYNTDDLDNIQWMKNYDTKCVDDSSDFSQFDLVIGSSIKQISAEKIIAKKIPNEINIYDIGIGNFSSEFISIVETKDCKIFRIDNRAGISSMILGLFETNYLINKIMGVIKIKDIELVSGGRMGHEGAIIVDSVHSPSYIIGIADGKGKIKSSPQTEQEIKDLDFIKKLIKNI